MATLIAAANTGFTTASTWQVADSTSLLVSAASSTTLTTSYVLSSTFTPGAITIDGIAVWVNTRPGSTGTISVALDQATATVAGTEVTINVADIPSDGNCWVLFKFSAPVLLLAATAYSVKAKTSNATQVSLFRNATAGNWSRLLRTTTTGAPGAADNLYVLGEKTGAGAQTARTVTMDDAAAGATVYGQIDLSAGGTLTYGVSASTAYFLKIAGDLNVRAGGTLNIGTAGSPMPSTSSAVLEFNCGSNVQFGLLVKAGGVIETHGNAIANVKAKLAADAAATATSLTTDISTGWLSGDEIALASTTATASQCEKKSLTAPAAGTTLTIAALTSAHSGTAPTQAELINLTRNVKIRGVSTSLQAYVVIENSSSCTWRYTELYQLGANDATKVGMRFNSASASSVLDVQFCSWHDFIVSLSGANVVPAAAINCNIVFSHNVSFGIPRWHLNFTDTGVSAGSVTLTDHVGIRVTGSIDGVIETGIAEMVMDSVVVVGGAASGDASLIIDGASGILNQFTNLTAHSSGFHGIAIKRGIANKNTNVANLTAWRNSTSGIVIGEANSGVGLHNLSITGTNTLFGNTAPSPDGQLQLGGLVANCKFYNFILDGGVTIVANNGLYGNGGGGVFNCFINCYFYDCSFGATTAHAVSDVRSNTAGFTTWQTTFVNCVLASPTEIGSSAFVYPGSFMRFQRLDGTKYQSINFEGTILRDTAIFNGSPPSIRLTPITTTYKLEVPIRKQQVANGASVTISVAVRCSVIGDGAAYNGARPRLIQLKQPGAGTTSDVVLATATAASDGAFEVIGGTTAPVTDDTVLTFIVDCDGTAGWVNVDSLTIV